MDFNADVIKIACLNVTDLRGSNVGLTRPMATYV